MYLVEAADDICYQIIDLEDAFKLGILKYEQIKELYFGFYDREKDGKIIDNIEKTLKMVDDRNEQVSYLRAGVIGKLIYECIDIFLENREAILDGNFEKSLIGCLIKPSAEAMNIVREISYSDIYNHRSVVEIEIAGYKIIGTLLEEFIGAIVSPKNMYSKKILSLLPDQYKPVYAKTYYQLQSAVDFISGMTDVYALDLYRKIKGISLPGI